MAPMADRYHSPTTTITRHTDTYPFISPSKYTNALRDKIVLLTGSGRGIGRATALAFAAAGAHVACLSRTLSENETLVSEIQSKGYPKALPLAADVTDPAAASSAVQTIEKELGPVDILINNAGISRISDVAHEETLDKAWKVVEVNMRGPMNYVHAVLPSMKKRKAAGCVIINVVSILGAIDLPYFSAYGAAKAGMIRYTSTLDIECRPHSIRTYAVQPGMILETTLGHGVTNEAQHAEDEGLQGFMKEFVASMTDTVSLPADTFVALCAEEDARWLSGKYVDAAQDLGEVLDEAGKGKEGRIEKEGLYELKVDTL